MPTKTKPKRPTDCYMIPVKISGPDRQLISECLDIDSGTEVERLEQAVDSIAEALTFSSNMLRHVEHRPLPAHIVAALKPIEEASRKLAALVNPGNLPPAVLRELDVPEITGGEAWVLLMAIQTQAKLAIERLRGEKSSGAHVETFGHALASVKESLRCLFEALRPQNSQGDLNEYKESKAEFFRICRKYLPKPPTARKSKSP